MKKEGEEIIKVAEEVNSQSGIDEDEIERVMKSAPGPGYEGSKTSNSANFTVRIIPNHKVIINEKYWVEIDESDICLESTSAILLSNNNKFNLKTGIAQDIYQKGGPVI